MPVRSRLSAHASVLALTAGLLAAGCATDNPDPTGTGVTPVAPTDLFQATPPPRPVAVAGAEVYQNDPEYMQDNAAGLWGWGHELIGLSSAYAIADAQGLDATGQGITVGVIDSGIDFDHPELAANVHPLSSDQVILPFDPSDPSVGTRRNELQGPDDHGTFVAGIIGATRGEIPIVNPDGTTTGDTLVSGFHGVAYNSQILGLRADIGPDDYAEDACAAPQTSCGFQGPDLARAINYAVDNTDARILNLSLGGYDFSDEAVVEALQNAVDNNVLVVIAAGNTDTVDGQVVTPDAPAFPANLSESLFNRGLIVAVGSVDGDGLRSEFSAGAAGTGAPIENFLMAPGGYEPDRDTWLVDESEPDGIGSIVPETGGSLRADGGDERGVLEGDDPNDAQDPWYGEKVGTSFAAPYVAGSLAIMLSAFPTLQNDPALALQILYDTATDVGTVGLDDAYGHGLINLAAAFQPIGTTSIDFGNTAPPVDTVTAFAGPSGAFGDFAFASGLFDGALYRDGYGRGFYQVGTQAWAPAPSRALASFEGAALAQRLDARAALTPFGQAAFRAGDDTYVALTNLETDDTATPELRLSADMGRASLSVGRGFASPAPGGSAGGALLSPTAWSGGVAQLTGAQEWAALGYDLGAWSLGLRAGSGEDAGFQAASLARRFGAHVAAIETGIATEGDLALGSLVADRFGGEDGGETAFLATSWTGPAPLLAGWRAAARVEAAAPTLSDSSTAQITQDPLASAWSLGLARPFAFKGKSLIPAELGLTLAQPLRAETGALALTVPVQSTVEGTIFEDRVGALTPSGREINLETTLRLRLADGAETTFAARVADEPGHVKSADPETAVWWGLRLTR